MNGLKFVRIAAILASCASLTAVLLPALAQNPQNPGSDSPTPGMMQPSPSPTTSPSPRPSPTTSPSPRPSPTTSPSPLPSPTTSPSPRPSPSPTTPPTSSQTLGELLQTASSAGQFRILAQAVQASGVGGTLASQGGQFTILAPTDAAFNALPPGTLNRLLQPQNRALLTRLLAYHVVPGRVTSAQLRTGGLRTLGGGVAVRVTPQRIVINDGSVVQPDLQARNGVVHGVSRVLMPRDLRQQINNLR